MITERSIVSMETSRQYHNRFMQWSITLLYTVHVHVHVYVYIHTCKYTCIYMHVHVHVFTGVLGLTIAGLYGQLNVRLFAERTGREGG